MTPPALRAGLLVVVGALLTAGCSSPPPANDEMAKAGAIIQKNCIRCHDQDHALDLRSLPEPGDLETWERVLDEVETARMPPPDGGTIAQRFPLDPAPRRALVSAVRAIIDRARSANEVRSIKYSQGAWFSAIAKMSGRFITKQQLDAITVRYSVRNPISPALRRITDGLACVDICGAFVAADLARPPAARVLLARYREPGGFEDDEAAAGFVAAFLRGAFDREPTATELARGRASWQRLSSEITAPRDATIAFCTATLTSQAMLRLRFEGGPDGP